jgi:hypothetical protein
MMTILQGPGGNILTFEELLEKKIREEKDMVKS